jgi:hypothetical protein
LAEHHRATLSVAEFYREWTPKSAPKLFLSQSYYHVVNGVSYGHRIILSFADAVGRLLSSIGSGHKRSFMPNRRPMLLPEVMQRHSCGHRYDKSDHARRQCRKVL